MDGINRVKLAKYHQRRGLMMLQCAGADRGSEAFAEFARDNFAAAREQMRLARIELGMVKCKQWWIVEGGQRVAVVSAMNQDEAWSFYDRTRGDEFGFADDVELCTAFEGRPTKAVGFEYWCDV
jgi:hypothetical protein